MRPRATFSSTGIRGSGTSAHRSSGRTLVPCSRVIDARCRKRILATTRRRLRSSTTSTWRPDVADPPKLLQQDDRPTAAIAISALLAVGVLEEARQRGLDVPSDLAIVGYADIDVTRSTHPPLTMIALPIFDAGVAAMTALQRMIAGELKKPERLVFEGTLEIRESCGPHPMDHGPVR